MFGKYFTFIVLISNYNNGQLMFYHYSQAKICILRRNPKGASENELHHPWPRPVGVKMYVKKNPTEALIISGHCIIMVSIGLLDY